MKNKILNKEYNFEKSESTIDSIYRCQINDFINISLYNESNWWSARIWIYKLPIGGFCGSSIYDFDLINVSKSDSLYPCICKIENKILEYIKTNKDRSCD